MDGAVDLTVVADANLQRIIWKKEGREEVEFDPVHNAHIEQFGGAVYKIQPYMIPRNILLLRINRVWDSGAHFEPNSMNTES